MYKVQPNAHAYIGEHLESGPFKPVRRLFLVYYEPVTDIDGAQLDGLVSDNGFRLAFSKSVLEIGFETDLIPKLLECVREIYDLPRAP